MFFKFGLALLLAVSVSAQKSAYLLRYPFGCDVMPDVSPTRMSPGCNYDPDSGRWKKYECQMSTVDGSDIIRMTEHSAPMCDETTVINEQHFPLAAAPCTDGYKWVCEAPVMSCLAVKQYHPTTGECSGTRPSYVTAIEPEACVKIDDGADGKTQSFTCMADGKVAVRTFDTPDGCFGTPSVHYVDSNVCIPDDDHPGSFFSFDCSCDLSYGVADIPTFTPPSPVEGYGFVRETFTDGTCSDFTFGTVYHGGSPVDSGDDHATFAICVESETAGEPPVPAYMTSSGYVQRVDTGCQWDAEDGQWIKNSCQTREDNTCSKPSTMRSEVGIVLAWEKACYGGASRFHFAKFGRCNSEVRTRTDAAGLPVTETSSWMLMRTPSAGVVQLLNFETADCTGDARPGTFERDVCKPIEDDSDDDDVYMLYSTSCEVPPDDEYGWYPSVPDCRRAVPSAFWHPDGGFITDDMMLAADPTPVHTEEDGHMWYTLREDLHHKLQIAPWAGPHCSGDREH